MTARTAAVSTSSQRCWCRPLGWPDTQVFLDCGRAVAMSFPPAALYLSARACAPGWTPAGRQPLVPPGSSHDPCCFHRAAPSYFSPAAARPPQLSAGLPEVNFQKQVRTQGKDVWDVALGQCWEALGFRLKAEREVSASHFPSPLSLVMLVPSEGDSCGECGSAGYCQAVNRCSF